jgi:chromosome segregation ATPase
MATAQCFMIGTTTFRGMLIDMGVTMESSKATTNVRWLIEHSYRNTLNQLALDMSRAEDDGFQPKVCKSVKDSLKVLLQPLEELDSEVPGIGQATEEYRRVYKDWNDDADNPEARARHLRELRKRRADLKIVIDTNRDLISGSLETGALQGALEEVLDYTKEAPVALGKLRQEVRRTLQQIERASG